MDDGDDGGDVRNRLTLTQQSLQESHPNLVVNMSQHRHLGSAPFLNIWKPSGQEGIHCLPAIHLVVSAFRRPDQTMGVFFSLYTFAGKLLSTDETTSPAFKAYFRVLCPAKDNFILRVNKAILGPAHSFGLDL